MAYLQANLDEENKGDGLICFLLVFRPVPFFILAAPTSVFKLQAGLGEEVGRITPGENPKSYIPATSSEIQKRAPQ